MNNLILKRCNELFSVKNGQLIRLTNQSSNARIGDIAGWVDNTGYLKVRIDKKVMLVHRVIYLMTTGKLPEIVDHIDRNILNNNPENLREATKQENSWNRAPNDRSISGIKGVYLDKGRWKVSITVSGVKYHLGMFGTKEEAELVANNAYLKFHGDFANKGIKYVPSTKENK